MQLGKSCLPLFLLFVAGCSSSLLSLPKDCKQVAAQTLLKTYEDSENQSYYINTIYRVIDFNSPQEGKKYPYGKKWFQRYDLSIDAYGKLSGVMNFLQCKRKDGCNRYQFTGYKEPDPGLQYLDNLQMNAASPIKLNDDAIQCKLNAKTSTGQYDDFMITFIKGRGYKVQPMTPARVEFTLQQ